MRAKYTYFNSVKNFNLSGRLVNVKKEIWGILNITPDSFYDGGKYSDIEHAIRQAEKMLEDGANVIDIGASSSRPGADLISADEEWSRLAPVLKALVKKINGVVISVDTYRSCIAEKAINEGAQIINDISGGLADNKIFDTVAKNNTPYVLMHMRGGPTIMHQKQTYRNVALEVVRELSEQIIFAQKAGVKDIIIDPGFGFSKNVDQNLELLGKLEYLTVLKMPILVGVSRKSMIYKTLNTTPMEALNGTTVLNTLALLKYADILRVHDVREAKQVLSLLNSLP